MRPNKERAIMNNLTPRGWLVLVIVPSLLLLVGLWEVSSHLWYVGEGGNWLGYCWGSVVECYNIVEGGE
jgi:hypothetical protein